MASEHDFGKEQAVDSVLDASLGRFDGDLTEFIENFRLCLHQYTSLTDYTYPNGKGRMTNAQLEQLRNDPAHNRSCRAFLEPSNKQIEAHLLSRGASTLFVSNPEDVQTLLLMVDLDNKNGAAQIDAAAIYLRDTYLDGHGLIEPSTGGRGRHVYFAIDTRSVSPQHVHAVLNAYARLIRTDPRWIQWGVGLDCVFCGLPTLWEKEAGVWKIKHRGRTLRLPYTIGFNLRALKTLPAMGLAWFEQQLPESSPINLNPEDDLRGTQLSGAIPQGGMSNVWPHTDNPDGRVRRTACVSRMMVVTNGSCSPDDCLKAYHVHYRFTGDTAADIQRRWKDFERLIRKFRLTFRSRFGTHDNLHAHPFQKGQYLALATRLVHESEFQWKRREKLDHQRLADFVGVKVQDAFFAKVPKWFGRTSREATIKNFRVLYSKGLVDWRCESHQYARLLNIAVTHGMLKEYKGFVPPRVVVIGSKVEQMQGKARLIGPGPALAPEYKQFLHIYISAMASRLRTDLVEQEAA